MPKGNPTPVIDRVLARSDMSGDCWIWTGGCTSGGYGQITEYVDRKPYKRTVHKYVWEWAVGPIPEGMECDHLCRNKRCFNPDHIEIVTHLVNVQRGAEFNSKVLANRAKTHCSNGHPYDEENTYMHNGGRFCRTCNRDAVRKYRTGL